MQIGDFLDKFSKVEVGKKNDWKVICPVHADKKASLHITLENRKILLKCFAGCSTESICDALGLKMSDLFTQSQLQPQEKKIVATYDYHDEDGNTLFQVVRFDPKSFSQRHKNGKGEWVWNMDGVRRVLYHLPDLLIEDVIYLVEGEKDADNLWNWGKTATTSPGGASAWKDDYADSLQDKKVIIIPDNDVAGFSYAKTVAKSLKGKAKDIKCIILPEKFKDLSDWLEENHIDDLPEPKDISELEVKVEITTTGYTFQYQKIKVIVRRVDVHKDGRVTGEILIHSKDQTLLPPTQFNFSAARTRKQQADDLQKKYSEHDWASIFDFVSQEVQERARTGDPGQILESTDEEAIAPNYILYPFLMEGVPSVIYGDKGVNKTTLALLMVAYISLGLDDNPFGWAVSQQNVAFLDWETGFDLTKYNIQRLRHGMEIPYFRFAYRRCRFSLVDDLENIQLFLEKHHSTVVFLDSLGAACGGDILKAEPALKFFEALRQLSAPTTFIIAQNAKGENEKKSIFGSGYFEYYSRNIFEARQGDLSDESSKSIGIFHRAGNYSGRLKPIGLHLDFTEKIIKIEQEELNIAEFSERVKQTEILKEFLKDGAKPVAEIASHINASANRARVLLSRLKKRGIVTSPSRGQWGLALQDIT